MRAAQGILPLRWAISHECNLHISDVKKDQIKIKSPKYGILYVSFNIVAKLFCGFPSGKSSSDLWSSPDGFQTQSRSTYWAKKLTNSKDVYIKPSKYEINKSRTKWGIKGRRSYLNPLLEVGCEVGESGVRCLMCKLSHCSELQH